MIKSLLLSIIIISFSVMGESQTVIPFPSIDKKEFPQIKFSSTRTFSGESLYGYIDGGADLYLEYGFISLTVTEFAWQKGKYKAEIYKMTNPESAFGIFSVSRFRCKSRPDFTPYACQNKYQLQICSGTYYISIINESGSGADSAVSIIIGRNLNDQIKETSVDLQQFFPGVPAETIQNESYLVKGRLGVINCLAELDVYFKESTGFTAVLLNSAGKTFISVRFDDNEALEKFAVLQKWNLTMLSDVACKMQNGESVRKLSNNHLLIEIPNPQFAIRIP